MMIIRDGKKFRAKPTIGGVNANQEMMGILCIEAQQDRHQYSEKVECAATINTRTNASRYPVSDEADR
ncbi:hypothetical protein BCON_0230g00050 [Botryotinia convoluta]|uniref:Uncharacterized protein n=1 Tax=Botryotinia convoluta TaxID=54673 RepID=A0A4Z1HN96_9HELO|nr:hypothetical protein BCON_0230g00050 [Botryotinia convoluta]